VNPIADQAPSGVTESVSRRDHSSWMMFVMAAAIPVYAILLFGSGVGSLSMPTATALAALTYFVSICVYFFVARLALAGQTVLLWISSALAVMVGFLLAGTTGFWSVLTGMGMVLCGGVIVGIMTGLGYAQSRVFILGTLAVALFAVGQYWSIWPEAMAAATEVWKPKLAEMPSLLQTFGYNEETAIKLSGQMSRMVDLVIRLMPASTLLGSLAPFTVGYLWFVHQADRANPALACRSPFTTWHVPFGFTPVVIAAAAARLLGGESLQLVADNVLVGLSVYYCVGGLALVEYYLGRLHISRLLKVIFYVLLFFTQLAGFVTAAILGFIDSFADWRSRAEAADAEEA